MIYRAVLVVLVAATFGAAVPAAGVSLPVVPRDVQVGGVEVGGLISIQAEQKVARRYAERIHLFLGERTFSVAPGRLGAAPSVDAAVEQALEADAGTAVPLQIEVRRKAVRRYVRKLNKQLARPAKEAQLVGLANLAPSFSKAERGRRVDEAVMVRRVTRALRSSFRNIRMQIAMAPVEPKTTADDYGSIVVIRRGSNTLQLYDGPRLVRNFTVATGQPEFPTPLGEWRIVVRERDPTWNPPPSDWAKDAKPIPPGPGNPLGTRWMGLDAYAVGIHGTPDAASLGYSRSHGCIRMAIPEAEWLFEQVEVGTPVYIVAA